MSSARRAVSVVSIYGAMGAASGLVVLALAGIDPLAYLVLPGLLFGVFVLWATAILHNVGISELQLNAWQGFWFTTVLAISYLPTPWITRVGAWALKAGQGTEFGMQDAFLTFVVPGVYASLCVAAGFLILVRRLSLFGLGSLILVGITAGPISVALLNLFGLETISVTLFPVCHALSGAAAGIWLIDGHSYMPAKQH